MCNTVLLFCSLDIIPHPRHHSTSQALFHIPETITHPRPRHTSQTAAHIPGNSHIPGRYPHLRHCPTSQETFSILDNVPYPTTLPHPRQLPHPRHRPTTQATSHIPGQSPAGAAGTNLMAGAAVKHLRSFIRTEDMTPSLQLHVGNIAPSSIFLV